MVLQAGAAQAELESGEGRTLTRLAAIESSGRQALDELRRILAATRNGDVETEPMPTLAELPALAERTSAAGLPVDMSVAVSSALSPGLSLSVYRIVQEALTNALKHASATRVSVRISEEQEAIVIEVRDDGRGEARPNVEGSGRGLIGVRERAAMFGGSVEAGADPDRGGFVVRTRLLRTEPSP
jgi:signal transduction histidine kinase